MRGRRIWAGLAIMACMSACAAPPVIPGADRAPRAPDGPLPRIAPPDRGAQDPDMLVASARALTSSLRARGLLRTETAPADAPVTSARLTRDFIDIALYDEYHRSDGQISARKTETRLHRWTGPVRIAVTFGDQVPEDRRIRDRNAVGAYAAQLARYSGHPISVSPVGTANFHVLFLSEDERRAARPLLRRLIPDIPADLENALIALPPETHCAVIAFSSSGSWETVQALAVIRDEYRGLMRQACIHEEVAQGLGLSNDSPHARPSIFNDDSEFALLTRHDQQLLAILYDPRLRPGMTVAEVRAQLPRIVDDVMAAPSTPEGRT